MTLPRPTLFYGHAVKWLLGFSAVSTMVAIIGPFLGDRAIEYFLLLPFTHCLVFWLVLLILNLFVPPYGNEVESHLEDH